MRSLGGLLRCSVMVLSAVALSWAQTDRGTITGTVTDVSGAVVTSAKVTATNTATGFEFETKTSQAGVYTIPQVTVGVYRITVEQAGFKKSVQASISG